MTIDGFCQSLWTFLIETWKFSREFHGCLAFNSWKFENKTGYVLQSEKGQIKSNTWFSMDSFTGMWHEGFNRNWSFPILGNKSIWSMQKYQVLPETWEHYHQIPGYESTFNQHKLRSNTHLGLPLGHGEDDDNPLGFRCTGVHYFQWPMIWLMIAIFILFPNTFNFSF